MLATDGSWQIFKQVGGFGRFIRQAKGNIGAGKDGLHVPDASADRAGSSWQLPNLRYGARTQNSDRHRRRRERGTARHGATILDRCGAGVAGFCSWNGASVSECANVDCERLVALAAVFLEHAGCALGGCTIFSARLAVGPQPIAQHVYAYRDGSGCRLYI